jgi:SAM-dependent methyltransferase
LLENPMHDTALAIGAAFFAAYGRPGCRILDVGSYDVNGSLRSIAPAESHYTGVDLGPGPGVDLVLETAQRYPFDDCSFDLVVSTSCFEHDGMFWLTFLEMMRVTRPGGVVFINAPSNGAYHAYPTDIWRFYPDAGIALEAWGRHQGRAVTLLESFVAPRLADCWNDFVMVFGKGEPAPAPAGLADQVAGAHNIRIPSRSATLLNELAETEDMRLLRQSREALAASQARIAVLERQLRELGAEPTPG